MPNGDPRDGFFYPTPTLMKDSLMIKPQGGTHIFFLICRLGHSIYRSPQKISGISSSQKIFEILPTKKISQFCTLTLKKISTKSSYPQKIFIFLKTRKNIEIQNFEPQKIAQAYVRVKISEYPPGDHASCSFSDSLKVWLCCNFRSCFIFNHYVIEKHWIYINKNNN